MKDHDQRGSGSGQVLVEALVGLALLVFVWALIAFATFMTTNHVRTAMASRHAAWQKGNRTEPSVEDIEKKFFFQAGVVKVESGVGVGIGSLISGANAVNMEQFSAGDHGPFIARVKFGMTAEDMNSGVPFPFTIMTTEFPLMPPTLMENYLQVESSCQWDEVGETWTDWNKALSGVMNTFKSEVKSALGKWASL
ncbi:MAG: hypothetical protein WCN95_14895 [bacterium]